MFQTTYDQNTRQKNFPHAQDANLVALDRDKDSYKVQGPMGTQTHPSGVFIMSASGTPAIPVYITSPIPVAVAVDIQTDAIKIFSASGTPTIPVYNTNPVEVIVDIADSIKVMSASGTNVLPIYNTNTVTAHIDNFPIVEHLDKSTDDVSIWSASGTATLPVYAPNDFKIIDYSNSVPKHDYRSIARDGAGNISSITYRLSGATVATMNVTRDGAGNITTLAVV